MISPIRLHLSKRETFSLAFWCQVTDIKVDFFLLCFYAHSLLHTLFVTLHGKQPLILLTVKDPAKRKTPSQKHLLSYSQGR